jgi:SAM-dependent methyltransferase
LSNDETIRAHAPLLGLSEAHEPFRRGADRGMLVIGEDDLRSIARRHAPAHGLVSVFLRQAFYESRVRRYKRIRFRSRRNDDARRAYCAMEPREFEGINARQRWANWRTIPRNLSGRVERRPLRVVDLCCGTGQSTEVLAHYLPPGSQILGLEYNTRFVEVARSRPYFHGRGARADVRFRAQSVLEAFRDDDDRVLAGESVDIVNSSGAVGCHFDAEATRVLAAEVERVLRPAGLALIDSGPGGTDQVQVRSIFEARGFETLHSARSCFLDRYTQVCFRKARPA